MVCVLDASMTLALFLPDETCPAGEVGERIFRDGAIAPTHWPFEVANGCAVARRRGRLTEEEVALVLGDIAAMNVSLEALHQASLPPAVLEIAFAHNLTVYDAAYLELALRRRLELATLDVRLREVARNLGCVLL
jgi:predicted nucleic acid-binding protein